MMIRTLLCAALFGLSAQAAASQTASSGCQTTPPDNGPHILQNQGINRSYRLHIPRSYDPDTPSPLLLAFHGWGGDADAIPDYWVVRRQAEQTGMIVVAPEGLGANEDRPNAWTFPGSATGIDGVGEAICNPNVIMDETYPSCASTAQNICSWTHCQADDKTFVADLLTTLENKLCIDTSRIYAAGASNGGMFVWGMGQDPILAPRLRAIASLIGLPHRDYLAGPGDADLPALVITGTEDASVPPGAWEDPRYTTSFDDAEYHYTGATAITRAWSEAHGCDTSTPAQPVDFGGRRHDCRSYCSVGDTLPAVLDCRMETGHNGHMRRTWPLIMDFFAAHSALDANAD
ncbi:MAG: hypothetical protein AAFQ64_09685 [Pseudomonadota bacterium]